MDTPERGQQHCGAAVSTVEDSPVFSYISNLSPIKPVKSVHITQTFHSWNFTSIPSVFSSPHLNTQKECRLSIRYPVLDLAAAELPSVNEDEKNITSGTSDVVELSECSIDVQENCNIKCSLNDSNIEPPKEEQILPVKLPRPMLNDCGSPNHNTSPCYGTKIHLRRVKGNLASFIRSDNEEQKIEMDTLRHRIQTKEEVSAVDWENLIEDDGGNAFLFDSTNESEACMDECQMDQSSGYFPSSLPNVSVDDGEHPQKGQADGILGACLQNPMSQLNVHEEYGQEAELVDSEHTPQVPPTCFKKSENDGLIEKMDEEAGHSYSSNCQANVQRRRIFRRRSLVFEVAGANILCDSKDAASCSFLVDIKPTSGGNQQGSRPGLGPKPHVLPSIGLHLNSLATTPKERILTEDNFSSGRQLMTISCSAGAFSSLTAVQRSANNSLDPDNTTCEDSDVQDLQLMPNSFQSPATENEEMNHSSERKKKSKPENPGENEACKRCNCKKSKCLKLYCECFAAGVYCVEPCACQGCLNKPIHEDTVLATRKQIESRNPLAFAPKVIRTSVQAAESGDDTNKTPASARHKRGCNCKKSSCLKKYCECYQGGVGCSVSCRCEGCKNTFGKREGIMGVGNEELEHEDEQLEFCEKDDEKQAETQNDLGVEKDKLFLEDVLPISPSFQISRPTARIPFFSNGKPPRSSVLTIGSSPLLNSCQSLKKTGVTKSRFEKHFQLVPDDETPEILKGTVSPTDGVKAVSPNRKRVSPPHNEIGLSPARKCGRKLILRSIPSFPSLTGDTIGDIPANYAKTSLNS